ncbi:methyltransferase domain-containing protein [Microbacterium bovistercoris]|uniref:Methyltransferase domain-containing protein n=1 Tax=Microbacterium bovistercoris TaxID=2293570 RepID=A0A371NQW7_9MICO|nr:methyltransferase domain-containing protein [Microbacterium bovistercoris]REJ04556.1 methyltransferase domain-containing protein [Microbacterium bovistercoris]
MAEVPGAACAASGAASPRRPAVSRSAHADSSEILQISDELAAIRDAFDLRAPAYDESEMHRSLADAVASFAATSNVGTVLDVATGTGLVLRALREHLPDARLIGVDISPGMLAVARESLPAAQFLEADAAALPLPDAATDLITCVTALHLIPDIRGSVQEWQRTLAPGGRLVTATFLMPDDAPAPDEHRHGPSASRPYVRDHRPFRSVEATAQTFSDLGFALNRHVVWADDVDTVLIAELLPEA